MGTLFDINCLYSETQVMLKLSRRERGHFVMLIEIRVHLIRVKPGHISFFLGFLVLFIPNKNQYFSRDWFIGYTLSPYVLVF